MSKHPTRITGIATMSVINTMAAYDKATIESVELLPFDQQDTLGQWQLTDKEADFCGIDYLRYQFVMSGKNITFARWSSYGVNVSAS